MKTTAKKTSSTTSKTATQTAQQVFFNKAGGGSFFVPAVQMKMAVNKPGDKFEQEADKMADKVMRMPAPASGKDEKLQRAPEEKIQKAPQAEEKLQKKAEDKLQRKGGDSAPAVSSNVQSAIHSKTTGGQPLSSDVRSFMEPRFNADFSNVRIHSDAESASLSNQLSARAFTYQNHIFFSRDQYQPGSSEGKQLLAHELTHTIQQGHAVQRSPQVSTTTTPPPVQRLGIRDALDYFADRANIIPGFRMFTIVLGVNPINMQAVDRSAANILRALIEIIPGGALITQALDNHGVFNRVGEWVEQQIRTLGMTGSIIRNAIDRFLDSLSWRDIFHLGSLWDRARNIVAEPIDRLLAFGRSLVNGIIQFIKDAILRPLAQLASQSRGWDLLCAVLGRNPITGDVVPRTAETLIGGFMRLIGQDEVWQNIQRGNAVARAWVWFQGALSGVLGFVQQIPTLFLNALRSLEIADIVLVPRALARVAGVFANFAGQFFSWAGQQVLSLLQIIFEAVAPRAMPYVQRAAGAFRTIIQDPIRFIGNLVRAGIQGFRQFAGNFLTHLRASLIGWLTGAMSGAGIYIPQAFNLQEILKFVLSVLGLTWQNIRGKLVRVVGETAVNALETGFDIVVTLVREGPAAAWQKILEAVGNLRDMVIEQVMSFVQNNIVQAAITRLISSLNPAGAFIQAIIATYNTIMFFVERLQQIGRVAMAFIDSISAIAGGVIGAAANRVEQTMGGMLTLVISFLARLVGLGNVAQAVTNIINRVRQPIDRALDRVVEWIVATARRLGRFVAQAGVPNDPAERMHLGLNAAEAAVNALRGPIVPRQLITPVLVVIKTRYAFRRLEPVEQNGEWWVEGDINPRNRKKTQKNVRGISVQQLGAAVEPILERVEREWLAERSATASAAERARFEEASTLVEAGGPAHLRRSRGRVELPPLTREQEIQILRMVQRGEIVIQSQSGRTMRAVVRLTGGTEPIGGIWVNVPSNLGRAVVGGARDYLVGIPDHVRRVREEVERDHAVPPEQKEAVTLQRLSADHRRLTAVLEPARRQGMLPARVLAEALAEADRARPSRIVERERQPTTAAEVTHGRLAPLAFEGAAGETMEDPQNVRRRHIRLGNIIQRLRNRAHTFQAGSDVTSQALAALVTAVEQWILATFRKSGSSPTAQDKERVAAQQNLDSEFLNLLRRMRR